MVEAGSTTSTRRLCGLFSAESLAEVNLCVDVVDPILLPVTIDT